MNPTFDRLNQVRWRQADIDLWKFLQKAPGDIDLHGAHILNPSITYAITDRILPLKYSRLHKAPAIHPAVPSEEPTDNEVPRGFILAGKIQLLFDINNLIANFYIYVGDLPSNNELGLPDDATPTFEMAVLNAPLQMSTLVPAFSGTHFDLVKLDNVKATYQNFRTYEGQTLGWHLDADITFDETYGVLHSLLKDFFRVAEPTLSISCGFGPSQDWKTPLWAPAFTLEGVFAGVSVQVNKWILITKTGARLLGYRSTTRSADTGEVITTTKYGFAVFGDLELMLPGRSLPLELSFEVMEADRNFRITAEAEVDWNFAFGVENLTLQNVSFEADFSLRDMSTLSFNVSATFEYGDTTVLFTGLYSPHSDNFEISATIENFDWITLSDIYATLFGASLCVPHLNVSIRMAHLTISRAHGLSISLEDINVENYIAVSGSLTLNSKEVSVRADIQTGSFHILDDLEISNLFVAVFYGRYEDGIETSLLLGGKFTWEGVLLDVDIHLYRPANTSGLEYTIYGWLRTDAQRDQFSLSSLIHGVKGTILDNLVLKGACLLIASQDDPELGALRNIDFPVQKGIQFCAIIEKLEPMNKLTKDNPPTLILRISWTKSLGSSWSLAASITFPSPVTLDLGRGVTTDPISIKITLDAPPKLKILGGVQVPIANQPAPFHFSLEMEVDSIGATATGVMEGEWRNPFGISDQLVIGPTLALSLSITWATGPSGFTFVGGFRFGKKHAEATYAINEIPSRSMVEIEAGDFDLCDLVSLVENILQIDLPEPENVITFHEVFLHVAPCDIRISETLSYSQGFSFKCRMTILGTLVDISVVIQPGGAHISGGFESFVIGPLSVEGTTKSLDVEISAARQGGHIDGKITLYDSCVELHAKLELNPPFTFEFDFDLFVANIFKLSVHATPDKLFNSNSLLSNAEYSLNATFDQTGTGYITDKLKERFSAFAQQQIKKEEEAMAALEEVKKHWDQTIEEKKAELESAWKDWHTKSKPFKDRLEQVGKFVDEKMKDLEGALDTSNSKYQELVSDAEQVLQEANAYRLEKMNEAKNTLSDTHKTWDGLINYAEDLLNTARNELYKAFGDVESLVKSAEDKVKYLEIAIAVLNARIKVCEDAPFWDLPKKAELVVLYPDRDIAVGLKIAADGSLRLANETLSSPEYIALKTAVKDAEIKLDDVRSAGHTAINEAETFLNEVDEYTDKGVKEADKSLENAHKDGQSTVKVAKETLEEWRKKGKKLIKDAQDAVDALVTCVEWIVFEAAKAALDLAKIEGDFAIQAAVKTYALVGAAERALIGAANWIAEQAMKLVEIRHVELNGKLSLACGGKPFTANVKGKLGDKDFDFTLKFDPRALIEFIEDLFLKAIDYIKRVILSLLPDLDVIDEIEVQERRSIQLEGYDMITTITQDAIDNQLHELWLAQPEFRRLYITNTNGKTILMDCKMGPPKVQFQLGMNDYAILFFLRFESGTFQWYNSTEEEMESMTITCWTMAFEVKLNLVLYSNPSNSLALVANLKNNGVDQPGDYNVMQLIIDFTTAELATYRSELSYLPGLSSSSGRTVNDIAEIRTAFHNKVKTYLKGLNFSSEGHQHALFNIPMFTKIDKFYAPAIPPTSLAFHCYPFRNNPEDKDVEGLGKNMLLVLQMTNKRASPGKQLNISRNFVVSPLIGRVPDGAVVLSRRIFFEEWVIPMLNVVNRQRLVSVSNVFLGTSNTSYTAGYEFTDASDPDSAYRFVLSTTNVGLWEFNHTSNKEASDSRAEVDAKTEVYHSVKFEPGTSRISIHGTSRAQVSVKLKSNNQGATVWASTEWDRTFIFAADDDGGLMIVLEEPEAILKHGNDVLPAGDSQIQYYHNENRKTADPCYYIHRQVPDNIFRDVLRKMQDLFQDQWAFYFAGNNAYKITKAGFSNIGDLILDFNRL